MGVLLEQCHHHLLWALIYDTRPKDTFTSVEGGEGCPTFVIACRFFESSRGNPNVRLGAFGNVLEGATTEGFQSTVAAPNRSAH